MLRFLFLLLAVFTDYRIVPEIAHCALAAGLGAVAVLCSITVCLVIRHRLARRPH